MSTNEIYHLLRSEDVPNSIAGEYYEFIFWCGRVNYDVRIGGDYLMFCVESDILFEFEISQCSTQSEISCIVASISLLLYQARWNEERTIYSTEFDVSSSGNDTRILSLIRRLMIMG